MNAPRIVPLGDSALLAEFSQTLDLAVNARIQQLARAIRARNEPWIRDVVPALGTLALHFDHAQCVAGFSPWDAAERLIRDCLEALGAMTDVDAAQRRIEVPVCHDADFAPDLADVASRCGLDVDEVIARHCASAHRVLMVGFVPGHPYIGGLDPALSVPRRTTPRPKVAAGSIAIANAQTVIYPFTIPGGWSIIGRTPLRVFDAMREPPAILAPGDRVTFVAIGRERFDELARGSAEPAHGSAEPAHGSGESAHGSGESAHGSGEPAHGSGEPARGRGEIARGPGGRTAT